MRRNALSLRQQQGMVEVEDFDYLSGGKRECITRGEE